MEALSWIAGGPVRVYPVSPALPTWTVHCPSKGEWGSIKLFQFGTCGFGINSFAHSFKLPDRRPCYGI
jgi:hypothetical protein